jgi:tRNA nucleotidyltransferase (CCA-adding enzyme)
VSPFCAIVSRPYWPRSARLRGLCNGAALAATRGRAIAASAGSAYRPLVVADEVSVDEIDDRAELGWAALEAALAAPAPRGEIERLRADPRFATAVPEIARLFGVPQPPDKHPEIDTGLHSLMALEQAARLSDSPEVRFGALVHDVGKGLTPREEWPKHKDHEERGVPVVEGMCRRLGAPASFRELGVLAARWHGLAHKAHELRPGTLLDMLEAWDALARPERLEALIAVAWADKRGRTGMEEVGYPPAAVLRRVRDAVARVRTQPCQLRLRRLEAIADCQRGY